MIKFKITKTREYVWRINKSFSYEEMAYITCWHVSDTETGNLVIGGHVGGNNHTSGYAEIQRKKDAQAFIDGYAAAERGDPIQFKNGFAWISYSQRKAYGLDPTQDAFFTLGAALYFTTSNETTN